MLRLAGFYFAYFCHLGAFVAYFSLWLEARGYAPAEIAAAERAQTTPFKHTLTASPAALAASVVKPIPWSLAAAVLTTTPSAEYFTQSYFPIAAPASKGTINPFTIVFIGRAISFHLL